MCSSNYPPGVTGQEPYFDAMPDTTECLACGAEFEDRQDGAATCPDCTEIDEG